MAAQPLEGSGQEEDPALIERAREGDRSALEALLLRHQPWIYNLAVRMVWDPHDAEDITQEVLIKVMTRLGSFEGRSKFTTWLYRIVVNHVMTMRRRAWEGEEPSFEKYAASLAATPDSDPSTLGMSSVETAVLVEEVRVGCTAGMLMCLDREQRVIYVLAVLFGVSDSLGGELLQISRANFRKKLERARRDLRNFMNGQCGLVDPGNPCRCARKTRGFIEAGHVEPGNLRFAKGFEKRVLDVAAERAGEMDALADSAADEIYRSHPFMAVGDPRGLVSRVLDSPECRRVFEL